LILFPLVGQEPDIPDIIDFMQSGDELKIINAARYLQHLCYSKESVKDKVKFLVENATSPFISSSPWAWEVYWCFFRFNSRFPRKRDKKDETTIPEKNPEPIFTLEND